MVSISDNRKYHISLALLISCIILTVFIVIYSIYASLEDLNSLFVILIVGLLVIWILLLSPLFIFPMLGMIWAIKRDSKYVFYSALLGLIYALCFVIGWYLISTEKTLTWALLPFTIYPVTYKPPSSSG